MSHKKYIVTLTEAEREQLHHVTTRGRVAEREQLHHVTTRGRVRARKLIRAHILLNTDQSPDGGPAWSDEQISRTFHVDVTTVEKTRKAFVEDGLRLPWNTRSPPEPNPGSLMGIKKPI
jgi:hypothetical protein